MNKEVSAYTLRCRPGDLAIVTGGPAEIGNLGKVLTCLEFIPRLAVKHGVLLTDSLLGVPGWRVDTPINWVNPKTRHRTQLPFIRDAALRPLRGDLTQDEVQREMEAV